MATTQTTITISDGTTSLDLLAATAYELNDQGWAPSVAARRQDDLGGSLYEDVSEDISVNVLGSTSTVLLTNLAVLSQLLDQADAWSNGADVSPVYLRMQPKGSNLAASMQSLIVGRDRDELLAFPNTIVDHLVGKTIEEAHIRFRRRGLWLAPAAVSIGSSSAVASGTLMTCPAAPAQVIPAPLVAELFMAAAAIPAGVLIVAPSTRIAIVEAEAAATTNWTNVTESTHNARSGHLLRYTPVAITPSTSAYVTFSSGAVFKRMVVFAVVKNNHASTTWQLKANISSESLSDSGSTVSTRNNFIDTSVVNPNPQVVCLGEIAHPDAGRRISLTATASAAAGTLDIDYLVIVAVEDGTTNIISHAAVDASGFSGSATLQVNLVGNGLTPQVIVGGTGTIPVDYQGDAYFEMPGTDVAGVWLATGGSAADSWRYCTGAGTPPPVATVALRTYRWPAATVPQ